MTQQATTVTPERQAFLDRMEKRIEGEIAQSLKYIGGFEEELKESSDNQTRAVTEELSNKAKELLTQHRTALHKIKTGRYGFCCGCDEEIPIKRLDSMPHIITCVKCATLAERGCK